ncbi:MAG: hypothetical protein M5U26_26605 [Planctomycetota bacterium]|nr:hypothetical protein [Planctomycetota bacterium]
MSETGPVPHPDFFAPGKKLTGVVGALGGLCVFWTVLGLMFYTRRPPAPAPKGPEGRPAQEVLLEVRAQHELELKTYGWVDKEKGVVRVPIERAMELLLAGPAREEVQP